VQLLPDLVRVYEEVAHGTEAQPFVTGLVVALVEEVESTLDECFRQLAWPAGPQRVGSGAAGTRPLHCRSDQSGLILDQAGTLILVVPLLRDVRCPVLAFGRWHGVHPPLHHPRVCGDDVAAPLGEVRGLLGDYRGCWLRDARGLLHWCLIVMLHIARSHSVDCLHERR
jgi:hypothetical protein